MTRFASSVPFLLINLRMDYSAVQLALVNVIPNKEDSSAVKDRSNVEEAKWILRKINSWVFCLSLSGCSDIYNVYGIFSNICQKLMFSHNSAGPSSRCNRNIFEDDESLGSFQLSRKMFMAKISC